MTENTESVAPQEAGTEPPDIGGYADFLRSLADRQWSMSERRARVPETLRRIADACSVASGERARLRAVEAENARLRQSWTPALRDQLVRTYDARYEELSDDRYEDTEGGMSMREKSERSMAAVLAVFRHWCLTGEVKHWRDVPAEAHDAKA
jgi:hypothetical protein